MSKDDIRDVPLRELVRQSLNNIEDLKIESEKHRKESEVFRERTSKKLIEISIHNAYAKETIIEHDLKITILDAYRNKTYGVIAVIGVIFGAIAGWLVSLIKH